MQIFGLARISILSAVFTVNTDRKLFQAMACGLNADLNRSAQTAVNGDGFLSDKFDLGKCSVIRINNDVVRKRYDNGRKGDCERSGFYEPVFQPELRSVVGLSCQNDGLSVRE